MASPHPPAKTRARPESLRERILGGRPKESWLAAYGASHRHPVNRACHLVGIPLITGSLLAAPLLLRWPGWWPVPCAAFLTGWLLQFAGHAVEGRPPEFLRDWRFLLVGFAWWLRKVTRRR